MTEASGPVDPSAEIAFVYPPAAVAACCSAVYGHPFAALIVGESFHPGGLAGTRELLDAAGVSAGDELLDLGCGLGASSRLAHDDYGLRVTAVDLSHNVVKQARERSDDRDITFQRADAERLPFGDDSFDVVLAECVLSTAPATRAMSEIKRVLRPDGVLLFSDVRRSGRPVSALEEHPLLGTALCVSTAWLPGEYERVSRAAGMDPVRVWDRDAAVLALLDRIDGRLTIARDLLSGTSRTGATADALAGVDSASVKRLIDSTRASVETKDIGYFAALARPRAVPAAST